jgi:hypothetical protein
MENDGIFYVNLVYFTAIGNTLWPFGIFWGHLIYFSPFWYVVPRKIWQPCSPFDGGVSVSVQSSNVDIIDHQNVDKTNENVDFILTLLTAIPPRGLGDSQHM